MKLSRNPAFTTALPVVLYLIFVFVFFAGPLTGHGSLSKAHILAEWDSLFDAQRTGQSILMDPSLLFLMIPSYLLKAQLIHSGQLPLWNPYTGLGAPLLADPQSLSFSPLHIPLLISPTMGMLNFVLALEVAVLGISTYMLCRALKLSVFASTFAMIVASMCPYHLYYLELLGNGFCMVPLAFWMIFRLKGEDLVARLKSAWLSALGLACCIYSAHVEMSFFAITLACLCKLLSTTLDQDNRKKLGQNITAIATTGLFTALLASPMLLPFLEFVKNSECYKFGSGAPAIIPWQAVLYNLITPGYGGASPTLGPIALPLIFIALFNKKLKATVRSFALAALAAICVMTKLGPLEALFTCSPFSFIVVTYALPSTLIILTVLSACGLDKAIEPKEDKRTRTAILVSAFEALVLIALFPAIVQFAHIPLSQANFDLCVGNYTLNKADITRYTLAAVGFVIALFWHKLKPSKTSAIALGALAICSYLTLMTVSRRAMPTWPKFTYSQTETIKALQTVTGHDRFIATGSHLFRSNSSDVYGLRDLRAHNPLFPKRFLGMLKICGAKIDTFSQELVSPLSSKLDLCSIKAVASQTPVTDLSVLPDNDQVVSPTTIQISAASKSQPYNLAIQLDRLTLDRSQRAIFANLSGQSNETIPDNISFSYGLSDTTGSPLWFSDQTPIKNLLSKEPVLATIPVPNTSMGGNINIQFFDTAKGCFLKVKSTDQKEPKDWFELTQFSWSEAQKAPPESAYKLKSESDHIRIYQNNNALPRAYFCSEAHLAKDGDEALRYIQSKEFKPQEEIVLELDSLREKPDTSEITAAKKQIVAADYIQDSANKVVLAVAAPASGYVVLNDIWYPGWQATLDNKAVAICHANYAMRAVPVPQGKHKISFEYKPFSFSLGVICFFVALLCGACLQMLKRRKSNI
jgi:hypothetical protein